MLLLTCLFMGIGLVTAQTQKVTGVVISEEDGQPVVGASVLAKGTTVGVITDVDGKFTLSGIPSSAKTLQISYIGMQTVEVAIKPVVKITLKPDTEVLDEVVVTGYGNFKKSSFTGAASSITTEKLQDVPSLSVQDKLVQLPVYRLHLLPDNRVLWNLCVSVEWDQSMPVMIRCM